MLGRITHYILQNRWISYSLGILIVLGGVLSNPFNIEGNSVFPETSLRLAAVPDLGENQQLIRTEWMGHSPEEVENAITYPLSSSLMGIKGLNRIRSSSMEGLSMIYLIFEQGVSPQQARQQITQQLLGISSSELPTGVSPHLGPEALPTGQIFNYYLEGQEAHGNPSLSLHELRKYQEYFVKPELESIQGVAEVASVGGYLGEFQIILDPRKAHLHGVSIFEVIRAVKGVGNDLSLGEISSNGLRYSLQLRGEIHQLSTLGQLPIVSSKNKVLRLADIANIQLGPQDRKGALDKDGQEVVGGTIYMQEGAQALKVISHIEEKIRELNRSGNQKVLDDGSHVSISITPYYNISSLIKEVLGTLSHTLKLELLISFLVVLMALRSLKLSLVVSLLLPLAILFCFSIMNLQGIEAHLLSIAGIALAIGSVVDMGIILSEHTARLIKEDDSLPTDEAILSAVKQTGPALLVSMGTTILSFLPIFLLQHAEGKMFIPLALTKTYILLGSIIISFFLLPVALSHAYSDSPPWAKFTSILSKKNLLLFIGLIGIFFQWQSVFIILAGLTTKSSGQAKGGFFKQTGLFSYPLSIAFLGMYLIGQLSKVWRPLGYDHSLFLNFLLVASLLILYFFSLHVLFNKYEKALSWLITNTKTVAYSLVGILGLGILSWIGVSPVEAVLPQIAANQTYMAVKSWFPGLSRGYLPQLNEGAFLYMPSSATHLSFSQNLETLSLMDQHLANIPEVKHSLGKLGRASSALDPAPVSMFENLITLQPEYVSDTEGRPMKIQLDEEGKAVLNENGKYIPSARGEYVRLWRSHVHTEEDIWQEVAKLQFLGISQAPLLYPIESRQIMQMTGVNSPLAMVIKGAQLDSIEKSAHVLEQFLKTVPGVDPKSVYVQQLNGLPYIHIVPNLKALHTHGMTQPQLQKLLEVYLPGTLVGVSRQERAAYPLRVMVGREWKEDPGQLSYLPIVLPSGKSVRLGELADISMRPGPMAIKGENSFMVTYLTFSEEKGTSLYECAQRVEHLLSSHLEKEELKLATGTQHEMIGSYQQIQQASQRLKLVIPLSILCIFLLIYLQFKSVVQTTIISLGILVSCCGGLIFMAFWQMPISTIAFLNGHSLIDYLQLSSVELGIASWVGFIALVGISVDDGVILLSYIRNKTAKLTLSERETFIQAVISAGKQRLKPCL
ncbi:MAG: efflux RND transporter permease subunit [Bacteroidota bacterium]